MVVKVCFKLGVWLCSEWTNHIQTENLKLISDARVGFFCQFFFPLTEGGRCCANTDWYLQLFIILSSWTEAPVPTEQKRLRLRMPPIPRFTTGVVCSKNAFWNLFFIFSSNVYHIYLPSGTGKCRLFRSTLCLTWPVAAKNKLLHHYLPCKPDQLNIIVKRSSWRRFINLIF